MRTIATRDVVGGLAASVASSPPSPISGQTATDRATKCAAIVRKSDEKQIVYGVVYAPGEIDAHGETMTAADVETMCHKFMQVLVEKGGAVIDQQHDNVPVAAYPVENYIETQSGMDWPVGSWIMGVKVADPVIWQKIKDGEINGYSFEAMVAKMPMVVEVEMDPDVLAKTAEAEGHDHIFFLELDEEGRIVNGITSKDAGHRHTISAGTATDPVEGSNGMKTHAHRLPVY